MKFKKYLSIILSISFVFSSILPAQVFAEDNCDAKNSNGDYLHPRCTSPEARAPYHPNDNNLNIDSSCPLKNNSYIENAIKEIKSIEEKYNKAKSNTQKHKILTNEIVSAVAELNSYTVLFANTENMSLKEDLENKIAALNFKINFLTKCKESTGRTWWRILVDLLIAASITYLLRSCVIKEGGEMKRLLKESESKKCIIKSEKHPGLDGDFFVKCMTEKNELEKKANMKAVFSSIAGLLCFCSAITCVEFIVELFS